MNPKTWRLPGNQNACGFRKNGNRKWLVRQSIRLTSGRVIAAQAAGGNVGGKRVQRARLVAILATDKNRSVPVHALTEGRADTTRCQRQTLA